MVADTGRSFVATVGATLGKYVLLRELGAGGMGRVFEARHVRLGKRVAIKLLHSPLIASPKAVRRFLREGRACSRIAHPHVVEVLDTGVEDGHPYLVMELVEGVDLATWLRENQKLGQSELADIFLPLCSALWAVHQGGIVHRDLKPSNVILTRPRPQMVHPMLVDFGVAKLAFSETTDDLTKTDSTVGTVAYMAPEQTRSSRAAVPTTDQYALGVMLYECATGKRPFQGDSQYELMHAILHAELVPPSRYRPDLGPEFDALVLRALNRAPAERFPSVHALGAALLALAGPRAWAAWGPEFCGTDPPGGATEADAASPRARRQSASESPPALSQMQSSPASTMARTRSGGRLRAIGAACVLGAIVLALYATLLTPSADAAADHQSVPIQVAPEVTAKRVEQSTVAERVPIPIQHDARTGSSKTPVRQVTSSRPAFTNRSAPKSEESKTRAGAGAEHGASPQRGTNGAMILE